MDGLLVNQLCFIMGTRWQTVQSVCAYNAFLQKHVSHQSEMAALLNVGVWRKLEIVYFSSNQNYRHDLSFMIYFKEYYQIPNGY